MSRKKRVELIQLFSLGFRLISSDDSCSFSFRLIRYFYPHFRFFQRPKAKLRLKLLTNGVLDMARLWAKFMRARKYLLTIS